MSYDNWKTTDPGDERLGSVSASHVTCYRCCTCGWRGTGSTWRADHFYATGHTLIVPKEDPRYAVEPARQAG